MLIVALKKEKMNRNAQILSATHRVRFDEYLKLGVVQNSCYSICMDVLFTLNPIRYTAVVIVLNTVYDYCICRSDRLTKLLVYLIYYNTTCSKHFGYRCCVLFDILKDLCTYI